jgi:hypothetical protein
MLDVVLRTCEHTVVHPERGDRFIACDKTTLIKKCFISLLNSICYAKNDDIKLWILDDYSSESLLKYFDNICTDQNVNFEIVSLEESGYNYSALKQFEFCKDKGREWIYSVEDDYLHDKLAIEVLLKQAKNFQKNFGRNVALRPDDDVFTYSSNTTYSKSPCLLFLGYDRHWRTLYNTHNTFFTHVDVIKEYWELFASLAKFFRKTTVSEDGTINTIWSNGTNKDGPVPLFSPIPSLAYHISQNNEPQFGNCRKIWNEIKL